MADSISAFGFNILDPLSMLTFGEYFSAALVEEIPTDPNTGTVAVPPSSLNYVIMGNKIKFFTPPNTNFLVYGLPAVTKSSLDAVLAQIPDEYEDVLNAFIDYWIAVKKKLEGHGTLLQIAETMARNKRSNMNERLDIPQYAMQFAGEKLDLSEGF